MYGKGAGGCSQSSRGCAKRRARWLHRREARGYMPRRAGDCSRSIVRIPPLTAPYRGPKGYRTSSCFSPTVSDGFAFGNPFLRQEGVLYTTLTPTRMPEDALPVSEECAEFHVIWSVSFVPQVTVRPWGTGSCPRSAIHTLLHTPTTSV